MLIAANYNELENAQMAIKHLNETIPAIYRKFINIIKLTRQMQFGYQYMGALIMDENTSDFHPKFQDDYVLSVYRQEIEKLKADKKFSELKSFINRHKGISYTNISKLVLGESPKTLVGPTLVH